MTWLVGFLGFLAITFLGGVAVLIGLDMPGRERGFILGPVPGLPPEPTDRRIRNALDTRPLAVTGEVQSLDNF